MWKDREASSSLLVLWVVLIILPFTLAETKYGRYMMPLFPACAILAGGALDALIPGRRRVQLMQAFCVICLAIAVGSILFPPRARAIDMQILAGVADVYTVPGEHVVLYIDGETAWNYQNQFLWYGNRYSELLTNFDDLVTKLRSASHVLVITDKKSFQKLVDQALSFKLVGESPEFVCFQSQPRELSRAH